MSAEPHPDDPLEERVRAIASEVLGPAARSIPRDADLRATLGIDSLSALRTLAALETALGVRFPDERLGSFRTLASIIDFIEHDPACREPTEGTGGPT